MQWRSQAGARALATMCPTSAGPPENYRCRMYRYPVANRALKVHKGVEIELRSIAICILRITRSRMLPSLVPGAEEEHLVHTDALPVN